MERIKKAINDVSKNKEFALKIQNDDNTFIIKIINKSNKIIFEVLNINDDGQEYYQEYKIDDFRINHTYFNRFNDINDLYKELFIKLKSRDIFISQKNENEIIVKIYIFFLKKKEEIQFIIKKNTNTNKLFYASYNNNKEEEENALIKNDNVTIIKKNKKHHLYREKIYSIFSAIIIVVCFSIFIIIEYTKCNNSNEKKIVNKNKKLNGKAKRKYEGDSSEIKIDKIGNILSQIKSKLSSLKTLNGNGKYILFFDHYSNIYLNSNDAYPIFDHFRRNGRKEAYYFLLKDSQLYYKLKKENNLDNIIIVDINKKNQKSFQEMTLHFILNSKLIVYTYKNSYLNKIIKWSNYTLKAIYLDHGCPYFKETMFKSYLKKAIFKRAIVKIKPEFDMWIKHGWKASQLYKGALARWERFNHIENKRSAILIFFTWRNIKRENFLSSIFYKKINELFSNENFINYLISKKIKIFYKRHHSELMLTHGYHRNNHKYIYEVNDKDNFSKIIDDSSLLITDYSALSIDFMFQNKPVIFYLLDINDQNRAYKDKYNTKNLTQKMIFGNSYNNSNEVIEKTKYYVENNFILEDDLQKKYESLFYYKKNILGKLENIFDKIIAEK